MRFEPRAPDVEVNVEQGGHLLEFGKLAAGLGVAVVSVSVLFFFVVDVLVLFLPAQLEARIFERWRGEADSVSEVAAESAAEATGARIHQARAVLERLTTHWPDSGYRFRLEVVAGAEPNAFAIPGGIIRVTRALIEDAETENELAFVLAHELGHFHNRDHLRGLGRGAALAVVLGTFGAGGASDYTGVLATLAALGFGRRQEADADDFALGIVAAEYGHAGGATAFFERMLDREGARLVQVPWMTTHPLSRERIERLRLDADARGVPVEGALTPLVRIDP